MISPFDRPGGLYRESPQAEGCEGERSEKNNRGDDPSTEPSISSEEISTKSDLAGAMERIELDDVGSARSQETDPSWESTYSEEATETGVVLVLNPILKKGAKRVVDACSG